MLSNVLIDTIDLLRAYNILKISNLHTYKATF